ncbi:heat shock 70 kDa protein 16-like isoform X2 [Hibiscus syriacus]|uniref:heat shock 70 kDa protein 16-like isoform X2 n=1 Tax=Hibiscus syriacus TaxID=106335 RepID=UPI001921E7C0|nr:heat shock 70 kDa protein 16-like isoform X2 [Hibiscus syriacus]
MSVVGFDIGNEKCVIAAVKQRGVDVLLNDESKRETPALVCFGEKQRFLGSSAAASAMMHPKTTVSQVKRLIGRKFQEPDVQIELRVLPFETSEGQDGGILIHLKYLEEMHQFTPLQIMAMLFAHLKYMTETNLGLPVLDCVIGIPSYFTDLQRRAYLDAAAIAGLKPLRLMHDCTATALGYGIYKTDFSIASPTYVAFVDIGHCDTQVSVVSFEAGQMRILSHAFDSSLGGRDFDEILFGYFAACFKEQYNIDVCSNIRASIRLRAACEKLKKVLSANAEAPLNIECLMDEKDVKGFIKREEFEKLASGLLERINIPCAKGIADAGLTVGKIHAVELVGSGSRIPAITRQLASLFRREPCRTINAGECVARGCALQCAMLSPIFRVRDYEVQDCIPFSIELSLDETQILQGTNNVMFPRGQTIPSAKVLQLQRSSKFHLEAFYANPNELPFSIPLKISSFTIGPFQSSNTEKARVKVKVQLNLHGIITVVSAIEHVDNSGMSTEDARHIMNGSENGTSNASADGKTNDKTTERLDIPVCENINGTMTKVELMEAQDKELKLAQQDRTMEQTKERKNALEAYVYGMRNKLFNTYRGFASENEREDISRSLQETEEWLYNEGEDETEGAYTSKLEFLKKLVDPVEIRYKDEEARTQASRDLLKCIADLQMSTKSLPKEDREAIMNECYKAEQWLTEKTQQQDSLPKNTDPLLWSSEIQSMTEDLNMKCKQIVTQKAPHRDVDNND